MSGSQSRFLPSSFRISGLVKAWEAAARATTQTPTQTVTTVTAEAGLSASERRVPLLKQTFTPRKITNESTVATPQMPGQYPVTPPKAIEAPPICDSAHKAPAVSEVNAPTCLTPPPSDEAQIKNGTLVVPQTPESPTPLTRRDASNPLPMLTFNNSADESCEVDLKMSPERVSMLPTLDSHLPSPPPSPPADLTLKVDAPSAVVTTELPSALSVPAVVKTFRDMDVQTDPVVVIPVKRTKTTASGSVDSLAPEAKKLHISDSVTACISASAYSVAASAPTSPPASEVPGVKMVPKDSLEEVKSLLTKIESMDCVANAETVSGNKSTGFKMIPSESLEKARALMTSIESMECVKDLAANLLEAKVLLSEIVDMDYVKATIPYLAVPPPRARPTKTFLETAMSADEKLPDGQETCLETSSELVASAKGEALDVQDLIFFNSPDVETSPLPTPAPPNSLVEGVCNAAVSSQTRDDSKPYQVVIRNVGYCTLMHKVEAPAPENWEKRPVRRRKARVSDQFIMNKIKVCQGLVIAELKSVHANEERRLLALAQYI
ncbi:hypothetical protein EUX98_g4886 [Antrodiella citrinella]|uniref:Uncharacterized protein n=1 Tax=Antrodiella citrinella TaxID=2447956 RepID=A0A4S4MSX9_9APHY|nr:hypothetical protein EUX98_g4886 [Antrodiella citrinella]